MRRILFAAAFLAGAAAPLHASADIWTLNAGLATQRLVNRDTEDNSNYLNLMASVSYRSVKWNVSLDLEGRWDTSERDFDDTVYGRRGDFLRPVETLVYTGAEQPSM